MALVTLGDVSAEPALALWLFGIPLADTLEVLLRRLGRKISPFALVVRVSSCAEHAGLSVRHTALMMSRVNLFKNNQLILMVSQNKLRLGKFGATLLGLKIKVKSVMVFLT